MAAVTAEGKLWIDLVDVYGWLEERGIATEESSGVRFSVENDALVLIRDGKDAAKVDAAEFWTWVIDKHLPKGIAHYETVFGVPKVDGPDLVITFATSSGGDPRDWGVEPACLAEWKQPAAA